MVATAAVFPADKFTACTGRILGGAAGIHATEGAGDWAAVPGTIFRTLAE